MLDDFINPAQPSVALADLANVIRPINETINKAADDISSIEETIKYKLRMVIHSFFLPYLCVPIDSKLVFWFLPSFCGNFTGLTFLIRTLLCKTISRQDMILEMKQMKVQQEYYKENDATMRELNLNIVRVMSKIDGSLNDIMNAIR